MSHRNIDDVDKTMDEINEQTENMKQIQEALSAPIGAAADIDEVKSNFQLWVSLLVVASRKRCYSAEILTPISSLELNCFPSLFSKWEEEQIEFKN